MVSKKTTKVEPNNIDLPKALLEKNSELISLKKLFMSGELKNPHALSKTRKEIAQILTKINSEKNTLDKENK
jgi:ribosomal protein L29